MMVLAGCVRRSSTGQFSVDSRGSSMWSGELTRNTAGFGYSENQVTIALDTGSTGAGSKADARPVKEVPVWMAHSTVDTLDHMDRQLQQIQVMITLTLTLSKKYQCGWLIVPSIPLTTRTDSSNRYR